MNIPERTLSADGFEMHLATNHLGSFLFNNLIMDKLTANEGARIVNMSSNGYIFSPFRFADYNFEGNTLPEEEKPPRRFAKPMDSHGALDILQQLHMDRAKLQQSYTLHNCPSSSAIKGLHLSVFILEVCLSSRLRKFIALTILQP